MQNHFLCFSEKVISHLYYKLKILIFIYYFLIYGRPERFQYSQKMKTRLRHAFKVIIV